MQQPPPLLPIDIGHGIYLTEYEEDDVHDIFHILQDRTLHKNMLARMPWPYQVSDAVEWVQKCKADLKEERFPFNFAVRIGNARPTQKKLVATEEEGSPMHEKVVPKQQSFTENNEGRVIGSISIRGAHQVVRSRNRQQQEMVEGQTKEEQAREEKERRSHKASIGYYLDKDFRGQGIVPRALSAILELCFSDAVLALNRVEACILATNRSSARVLEKCGFTLEGRLRQYYQTPFAGVVDGLMYAALKEDKAPSPPTATRSSTIATTS